MLKILFYHASFSFPIFIDLYFLIPGVIAKIFNPFPELVIPIGIPIKEAKAETEIHLIIAEAKIRQLLIQLRDV